MLYAVSCIFFVLLAVAFFSWSTEVKFILLILFFFPWKPGIMFWISFHQGSRLGILCTWLPSNCTKSSDLSDCLLVTYYLNYFVTPFISVSVVSFLCFSAKSLEKLSYYFKSYNVLHQHNSPQLFPFYFLSSSVSSSVIDSIRQFTNRSPTEYHLLGGNSTH